MGTADMGWGLHFGRKNKRGTNLHSGQGKFYAPSISMGANGKCVNI
jgi:hypothetical protein